MIEEETLEFTYDENSPIEIDELESLIRKRGINPIRFSLIKMDRNKITLGVSGIRTRK